MSRIDDAIRRTRGDGPQAHSSAEPAQETFRADWTGVTDEVNRGEFARFDIIPSPGATSKGLVTFSSTWRERLATSDGDPILVEQFRRLAGTLHQAQRTSGLRVVMLTSANPGDGKTLTAVNLALVLADSYRARVLLIDADLRRPSIPHVVDLGDGAGLSEALKAPKEIKLTLVPITSHLTLLPAGRPIANSIEALTSPRMRHILEEAATRFDWVILDAPPVGPAADAHLLAEMVNGTLFVVRAGHTQCPDAQSALDVLGREHVLGIVLNGVEEMPTHAYYGMPRADLESR